MYCINENEYFKSIFYLHYFQVGYLTPSPYATIDIQCRVFVG